MRQVQNKLNQPQNKKFPTFVISRVGFFVYMLSIISVTAS